MEAATPASVIRPRDGCFPSSGTAALSRSRVSGRLLDAKDLHDLVAEVIDDLHCDPA